MGRDQLFIPAIDMIILDESMSEIKEVYTSKRYPQKIGKFLGVRFEVRDHAQDVIFVFDKAPYSIHNQSHYLEFKFEFWFLHLISYGRKSYIQLYFDKLYGRDIIPVSVEMELDKIYDEYGDD